MKIKVVLLIVCTFLSIPCFANNPGTCSPVGTWYGGGDYKYMIKITPITDNRFAIGSEAVYDNIAWGYKAWTSWSGELVRLKDGRYVAQEISMYTTSPDPQPPSNSFELDAVRGWMEFLNCNKVKFTYDFFGGYFDLTKKPFVDPLDINYLPPGGISETYHRMLSKCPACDAPSMAISSNRRQH